MWRARDLLVLACSLSLAGGLTAACDDTDDPTRDAGADAGADGKASDGGGGGDAAGGTAEAGATGDGAGDAVVDVAPDLDAVGVAVADAGDASAPDAPKDGAPTTFDGGPILPAAARKLDVLFVVDNSSSMAPKQASLAKAFPAFMSALAGDPGGRPDLHIAVISSNVGAGPGMPSPDCPAGGDRGLFQVRPGCGLDPVVAGGRFLAVDAAGKSNAAAGTALPDVFGCLATLGTNGCGYEHQLASLRLALDGHSNPANAGFVRDDAIVAVVLVSDEDDCSGTPDSSVYGGLVQGQAGSLRCSLLGVRCAGVAISPMLFSAPLAECVPYARAPGDDPATRLIDVADFVAALQAVKPGHPERISVSSVVGWSDAPEARFSLTTRMGSNGSEFDTGAICSDPTTGTATPAVRLHAFTAAFANGATYAICTPDLSVVMTSIAKRLLASLPAP